MSSHVSFQCHCVATMQGHQPPTIPEIQQLPQLFDLIVLFTHDHLECIACCSKGVVMLDNARILEAAQISRSGADTDIRGRASVKSHERIRRGRATGTPRWRP
eukprot:8737485-Pyramimonas_sp.AAC.1